MRLGLFGGSFSPIHNGHLRIALKAAGDYGLERVFVIPAGVSPFKTAAPPWPDDVRWRLVVELCRAHPMLVPCDWELESPNRPSYAIDTVRHFRAKYPEAELYYIVGEDSLAGLPRWRAYDELVREVKFVAYPRTFESSTEIRRRLAAGEDVARFFPPGYHAAAESEKSAMKNAT